LTTISIERAKLVDRKQNAIDRGGNLAPWHGSEIEPQTRIEAQRELVRIDAELTDLDRREAEARKGRRRDRAEHLAAIMEVQAPVRRALKTEIGEHWHAMLEAWRRLDDIDQPLIRDGARIRPHLSALQLELLCRKLLEDLLNDESSENRKS
jgi:hypothetical protein